MLDHNLTDNEKEQILQYLVKCLKKAQNKKRCYDSGFFVQERPETYNNLEATLFLMEITLSSLSDDSRRIIEQDYIVKREKEWWLDFYSKTTYYRLKRKAIDEFIRCLE